MYSLSKTFLTLCLLAGLTACDSQQNTQTTEATLRWTGMIAADGCGFFLDIDGEEYKAINEEEIPEALQQQDSSRVSLTYTMEEEPLEYNCGMVPGSRSIKAVRIVEITAL